MNFVALERFVRVVKVGSIRRVSQDLKIGQPQLSRQISHLENQLGTGLFVRTKKGVRPTEEGARVAALVEKLAEIWTVISHPSGFMFRREAATVRLGSIVPLGFESDLAASLAGLLAQWRIDHPRRPLYISNGTAERLLTDLLDGSIDAALLDTADMPEGFNNALISERRLVLVGPASVMKDTKVDIASLLKSHPVAFASRRSGLRLGTSRILAEFLRPIEIEALQMVEVQSLAIAFNLVLKHGYLSVLPEGAFTTENLPVGIRRLPQHHNFRMWLVWPPAAQALADTIIGVLVGNIEIAEPPPLRSE